ncbi:MAG: UDP-N-acetylmuramoyl-L-alanine--D-glutamate ligase [Verrucomicrobiales bacterium]
MNLKEQAIAVCGAGRSGQAAARLACAQGAHVTLLDSGEPSVPGLPDVDRVFGPEALTWREDVAHLVVSPGIDLANPLVAPWVEAGTSVLGEIELASRFWGKRVIGITGTNGKTTTTELITHLLNENGCSAVAGGNYGKPFAEIVLDDASYDVAVLELSSFQLETIDQFRPNVSVWMNFAPDHMDRYESVDDYRDAKLAMYRNQTAEDWAIVNLSNGPGIELIPQTLTFSAFDEGADFAYRDGQIFLRGESMASMSDTYLAGKHNAENLMAAMAVGSIQGLSTAGMRRAALSYRPPRHRCERVAQTDRGLLILNDSKATNVHALESSLRALDGPILLIAGGKQKGLSYDSLKPWLAEKVCHLVALGEIGQNLTELADGLCPSTVADSLMAAVKTAFREAPDNAIILFSPGTSSFDMFSGYEQRGDVFTDLVEQHLANI